MMAARRAVTGALLALAVIVGAAGCHTQTCKHHPERCYVHVNPAEEP